MSKRGLLSEFPPHCPSHDFMVHRILLELGGPEDPVWVFLDSQHKHILSQLKSTYEQSLKFVEGPSNFRKAT